MEMSVGARRLTVLSEFAPFGLTAEALEGKPDDYHYFLFDPDVTRDRDGPEHDFSAPAPSSDCSDHELFIRGIRAIWSTGGSKVHKIYTAPKTILKACWCRMDATSDALLCLLQADTLSIYSISGEVVSIPLLYSIASIWPLPFGLLLQKSVDGLRPILSSCSLLNARELSRPSKEFGSVHYMSNQHKSFEPFIKEDGAAMSSHLILRHPMEEPKATYIEERGRLSTMKDSEERTIWTSDVIPLMVSYQKGKSQHSVWLVGLTTNPEAVDASSVLDAVPSEPFTRQVSFRRIWQGKCSQSAANKVFIATDNEGVAIICLLLGEHKVLLAVRLEIDGRNAEDYDIRADTSWSISAVAASPVIVTRPRFKVGLLPFTDIVVLDLENFLLLYSGKQCLCKYVLPTCLREGLVSHGEQSSEITDLSYDLRITGVGDAIDGRINVITSSGKIFRCTLRRFPSSSLANDCITAMAEGLHSSIYYHFSLLLWGDSDSAYLSNVDSNVESEWESFTGVVMKICKRYLSNPLKDSCALPDTAWEFLINSKFHINYRRQAPSSIDFPVRGLYYRGSDYTAAFVQDGQSREVSFYAQLLKETLDSLHALYENLKLDNLRRQDIELLVVLLCNVAASLGETSYVDYYIRDFPCFFLEVRSFHPAVAPKSPPCLFRWLENCLRKGCHSANVNDLPSLVCKDSSYVLSWARKIVSFYSLLLGGERIGRKLSSGVLCDIAEGSARTPEELTVLAMVAEKFGHQQLDLLPVGVSLPLRHALDRCRESPPNDWPAAAYVLVGREDLAMTSLGSSSKEHGSRSNVNLISISVPYMLHLQPVTTSSTVSDTTGPNSVKPEDTDSIYNPEDGMEYIFNSSTQLRYGRDMRLNEVRRLLSSAKPVAIQSTVNPSGSDQDLQQHQLWNLAQRTTALPFGRGAFTLATTYTLLTETLVVPKLVLAGRLPAQQNATVNLDPNIRSISELKSWPEFHNGVAAGLRLAPFQGKMSRTWIHYNRPEEPTFTHAGLLLALGLHEHLRVLTITDVYHYLSEQHETSTVGILLGIAASYRRSMHPAISKMLYLHVPSRHPSNFPEVELPTLLQSAALMGVGLLYEGSAHPLTMKILLGEIGRRSGGDNVLEREGYAVAAGSALGLVALGRGNDAIGFIETFVDRLFHYVGGNEISNERSSNIGKINNDYNYSFGQVMDGTQINVDVTAPGATIALALIFLKTESEEMASRLYIPVTHFDLQYVRPDFIMLRIIARNLIMWSRVCPSSEWMESQIPEIVKVGTLRVGDGASDCDEFDAEALVQAYVNIVAGACISIGLKYAGTRNGDAQELLYGYATYFLNEIKHVTVTSGTSMPKGISRYVDRGTLEISLHLIVLSLCVVMAGSGHLQTFRLLRYLRGRSSTEGHVNYGIQMSVSLAIGFLFLGGGMQTFSTGNSAIASLLITLYPRLPTGPNDNRCHLQAFRHLYVIASESRRLQTVDVDTGLPVYAPLEVTVTETENYAETSFCEITPCILPERSVLKSVRVCGPRYWPQIVQLSPEDKPWWRPGDKGEPFSRGLLYIKRKVGSCSYVDDPVGSQSLLSRAMHKVCSNNEPDLSKVDQLISTFSADPSLIAFAQLCCDSSWNIRSDANFQEFCSQVLFECVSKDRPALLQVYLSLYTMIESMSDQVKDGHLCCHNSLFLSSLKLALAYNESLISGKLGHTGGGIVQSNFIESLGNRVEEILGCSQKLKDNFLNYMGKENWPSDFQDKDDAILLSWYLQWYGVPPPHVVMSAMEKIAAMNIPISSSTVPLLCLLLPTTNARAIIEIDKLQFGLKT